MKIIVGSSWGVGTFERGGKLSGPGIAQYLNLHDGVINLSIGAHSNYYLLRQLDKFLQRYTPNNDDTFFWIVNSPLINDERHGLDGICNATTTNLYDAILDKLYAQFDFANQLAKQFNITINLIGGLCDLDTVDIEKFSNLKIKVPSWGKLCDDSYAGCIFSFGGFDKLQIQVEKHNQNLLPEFFKLQATAYKKRRSMALLHTFFEANHPTQAAHIKLRDFLYPEQSHLL